MSADRDGQQSRDRWDLFTDDEIKVLVVALHTGDGWGAPFESNWGLSKELLRDLIAEAHRRGLEAVESWKGEW